MSTGADIGTMLTGASATTATYLWVRTRIREWRSDRDARKQRNWNGYIIREAIPTWNLRLVDNEETGLAGRVTFDVINPDGSPNLEMARALKLYVRDKGSLTRPPSVEQWAFLQDLRLQRFGAPKGYPLL